MGLPLGREMIQTKYQEEYTPSANRIVSANTEVKAGSASSVKLTCAVFSVEEAGTVSYKTLGGDIVTTYPVVAGQAYPYLVTHITAYSQSATKRIWIHHNGDRYNNIGTK